MSNIKKFEYESNVISFEFEDGNNMINATEMAKPFKKLVADFLRLKNTKEYIGILENDRYGNSHIAKKKEILRVVKGGANLDLQGTWMNEKLALKFASWLAPQFEAWVYDRIHELLKTGKTEIENTPAQSIIKSLRLIADQLEAHDRDIETLKDDMRNVKDYVGDLEAKIASIDENYYSISGYCSLNLIDCPHDQALNWGKRATSLSNQKNRLIGKAYDAKYGEVNTYHIDILRKIIL